MDTRSVIVAIASPPGPSARGIVRLSGEECWRVLVECTESTESKGLARIRGVRRARLRSPAPACPCLVVLMPGPGSSTGEDCVEIHLPGNSHLLERVADALVRAGGGAARRAGPGEFSARAVLNGRMTLEEAERVSRAVAAATDAQLQAADALRTHAAGMATHSAADRVATLLALVEAGIDFTDQEDVSAIAPSELARRANGIADELDALAAASAGAEAALSAPHVVLGGPPNAGKSSLFNALLDRTRAVAAPLAGTTRDVISEPLPLPGGRTVMLSDAPGLDAALSALDVTVRQHAEAALESADVVLWCTPAGDAVQPTPNLRARVVRVTTKRDLAPVSAPVSASAAQAISTSATQRTGLDLLRTAIAGALDSSTAHSAAERSALGGIHRALVGHAATALRDAASIAATAPSGARHVPSPELVAAALRCALDRLGEVAGAIPPDEVLGRLFSQFCIGK